MIGHQRTGLYCGLGTAGKPAKTLYKTFAIGHTIDNLTSFNCPHNHMMQCPWGLSAIAVKLSEGGHPSSLDAASSRS